MTLSSRFSHTSTTSRRRLANSSRKSHRSRRRLANSSRKSHRCTTSTIVCVHRRKSHLVFLAFIFLFSSYRRRTPPHPVVASVPPPPTSDPVGGIKLKHRRNPVYASVTQFSSPVPPVSLAHMRRSKASVTQFSSPVPPVCSSLTVTQTTPFCSGNCLE
ncbi:hypothetical protein R6Q59_012336 [Mikania micrantha]